MILSSIIERGLGISRGTSRSDYKNRRDLKANPIANKLVEKYHYSTIQGRVGSLGLFFSFHIFSKLEKKNRKTNIEALQYNALALL